MSLLRMEDGKVVHERPPTHKSVNAEVSARSDYKKRVEYIYDPETMRMRAEVHWMERGSGIECSGSR